MASLGLLSFFPARRPYALGALSLCVAVMLACDPAAAFSLSFMLSVAATLGIVVFCGFFTGFGLAHILLSR
jgi:predicted membrane metal-binding protein